MKIGDLCQSNQIFICPCLLQQGSVYEGRDSVIRDRSLDCLAFPVSIETFDKISETLNIFI